jgi:hypothetical protein
MILPPIEHIYALSERDTAAFHDFAQRLADALQKDVLLTTPEQCVLRCPWDNWRPARDIA